jgi:hypothetical protein
MARADASSDYKESPLAADPAASGRRGLQTLPDASGPALRAFVANVLAAGAIIHTDGWRSQRGEESMEKYGADPTRGGTARA